MSVGSLNRLGGADPAAASLKNGNLFLEDIVVDPQQPAPGSPITVYATVSNGAYIIGPGPDCCGPSCGIPGGGALNGWAYRVRTSWQFGGSTDETSEQCLGGTEVGTKSREHTLEMSAPHQTGTSTLVVTLALPGSGESASTTRSVTVSTGDGGDGGGGDGGGGNGGTGGGDTIFGLTQRQLVLGGAAVAGLGGLYLLAEEDYLQTGIGTSPRSPRRSTYGY